MKIIDDLDNKWKFNNYPVMIVEDKPIYFDDIKNSKSTHLEQIQQGDSVALIGDFDEQTIADFLRLIQIRTIIVPLSPLTRLEHEYFFEVAEVDWIIEKGCISKRISDRKSHLLNTIRTENNPGLILFSSGTTGRPKAILHDMTTFLERFKTPRPSLRTLAFLQFDHIGGINTLLHSLYNAGTVICTTNRTIKQVIDLCIRYEIEVLPTTPTFLRLLLISGFVPDQIPPTLKIITYGTERMDQETLDALCRLLPDVDFRQTYGMSELGILRIKSKSRNSLFMKVGGEGVEIKIVDGILNIRSRSRMLGYINADSPFDENDWYVTNDIVEVDNDWLKIVGRKGDVVNVGGLKFLLSEVERVAYSHKEIALAKATSRVNPITGQHVEISIQPRIDSQLDENELRDFFTLNLPNHMRPRKILLEKIDIGHRYKKL